MAEMDADTTSNEPPALEQPDRPVLSESLRMLGLSEGLLLAVVPVFGSAMAYAYQSGIARRFHVPRGFIVVSITTVFVAMAALALALVLLGSLLGIASRFNQPHGATRHWLYGPAELWLLR